MKKFVVLALSLAVAIIVFGPAPALAEQCFANVNCDTTVGNVTIDDDHVLRTDNMRSIVRMWDPYTGKSGSCTLINNVQCGDTIPQPYIMTCHHNIDSAIAGDYLDELCFIFSDADTCGHPDPTGDPTDTTGHNYIVGATFIVGSPKGNPSQLGRLDYALLELSSHPGDHASISPYYAGWDRTEEPDGYAVLLGHPLWDHMQIAIDTNTFEEESGTFRSDWEVAPFELGHCAQGSSGSGMLHLDGDDAKLIGVLYGVEALNTCGNTHAYGSRFADQWDWWSCYGNMTGDVNGVGGDTATIGDITLLVDHLFQTEPPLVCPAEGDTNNDGDVTISDVSTLIDALFTSGDLSLLALCSELRDDHSEVYPMLWDFLVPSEYDTLQSLDGWDPEDTYPYASGCD